MEKPKTTFSYIGIALGAFALMLALVHFYAGPFSPQPALEVSIAERAVAIRDATMAALRGEEPEQAKSVSDLDLDRIAHIVVAALGGLAVILGVVGYATKEPLRAGLGAVFLGGFAIAFQFVGVALGAIIFVVLVMAVLSSLGFG